MTVFLRRLVDISTDLSERKTLLFLVLWLFSDWVECLSVWHSPANSSRQSRMRRCGKGWLASNVESGKLKTPSRESVELPLPNQHRIDMGSGSQPKYSLFNLDWYVSSLKIWLELEDPCIRQQFYFIQALGEKKFQIIKGLWKSGQFLPAR